MLDQITQDKYKQVNTTFDTTSIEYCDDILSRVETQISYNNQVFDLMYVLLN